MRILVVEDDKLIGDGIKVGLTKMGFSIDWFTRGEEGKAALYTAPYDAAILDLTLPGIDGLDILRAWRNQGRHEPVLILTARDALSQRVEGLRLGADDYLCKPFALIEVAARLEALIRRAHGQSSSELRHGHVALDPIGLTVTTNGDNPAGGATADVPAADCAAEPGAGAVKTAGQNAAPARAGLSRIAKRRQSAQRSPTAGRCPESAVCPDA